MDDKLCLLVIIGVDDTGRTEVLSVLNGHRELEASWTELIEQLRAQGLQLAPKLAISDGELGFWKAVAKCWYIKQRMCLTRCPKAYNHE